MLSLTFMSDIAHTSVLSQYTETVRNTPLRLNQTLTSDHS